MIQRLFARIGSITTVMSRGTRCILDIDRHFHLQHIDAILWLREFFHVCLDILRLHLRKVETLLVMIIIISEWLEEERDIIRFALCTDTLDESLLALDDLGMIERVVIEQDLDRVSTRFNKTVDTPLIEQ